jgi:hypothetical protein
VRLLAQGSEQRMAQSIVLKFLLPALNLNLSRLFHFRISSNALFHPIYMALSAIDILAVTVRAPGRRPGRARVMGLPADRPKAGCSRVQRGRSTRSQTGND